MSGWFVGVPLRQRARVWLGIAAHLLICSSAHLEAQASRRPFSLDDLARIQDVSDPAISPDGEWVAYVVKSADLKEDRRQSDLWMVRWDGSRTVRLTHTPDASERAARWSPDGRWLAFLSSRGDTNEIAQLWLLDRLGGEAERVTMLGGGVNDYAWAPDGRRLALVVEDAEASKSRPRDDARDLPGRVPRIERPSFVRDRLERCVAWYDRFLKADGRTGGPAVSETAPTSPRRKVVRPPVRRPGPSTPARWDCSSTAVATADSPDPNRSAQL